uniref:J domain-containing protein n=1 Tax=Leersia perrieri TaxID=77586 RepID=A0A0D9UZN1_9ORYZ
MAGGYGDGDHYRTLGISRGATKAEVKAAFHRLAQIHHPDRHHATSESAARDAAASRFRRVYDAYNVLNDDTARAACDLRLRLRSSSHGRRRRRPLPDAGHRPRREQGGATMASGDGDGDHYRTLGISHGATKAEVKSAFRRLAQLHHPDRHHDAAAATSQFRRIYESYSVLNDDTARAAYDLRLRSSSSYYAGYTGGGGGSNSGWSGYGYGYSGLSRHGSGFPPAAMAGDHYQTLGLRRDATKAEVKAAFRRRALRDHPDRHAHSPDAAARADAARRFRLASDAYRVLSDDRLRADYDLRLRSPSSSSSYYYGRASTSSSSYGYGYGYGHRHGGGGGSWRRPPPGGGGGAASAAASAGFDWDLLMKAVTRRGFLINLGFASVLLTGAAFLDGSILEIWKMNNSGKSFEDAMESIEKVKVQKGNR